MTIARISLLDFRDGATGAEKERVVERVRAMNALASSMGSGFVATDLPPNRNGGDLIWRVEFGSEADHEALVAQPAWREADAALRADSGFGAAETFTFEPLAVGERGEEARGGLYRLLVFALEDETPDDKRARFETEMAAMPDYVGTILRWNFARVKASGDRHRWHYLWEQEYVDITGFRGEYMLNPYHWGFLDRWFDSENPARIVKPYLCNSFCPIDAPVMFTGWPRPSAVPFEP